MTETDSKTALATAADVAKLEAEERLAALSDEAARFAELAASGLPLDEAFARAGYSEGSAEEFARRHDVLAAISAVRERNLGDGPTDVRFLRRILRGALLFAHRDQDVRAVAAAAKILGELDGHLGPKATAAAAVEGLFALHIHVPGRPVAVFDPTGRYDEALPAARAELDVTPAAPAPQDVNGMLS